MTNQSIAGKRSFGTILSVAIVLVIMLLTFATTALADAVNHYDVTIVDGTNTITIATVETEPIEILTTAGITLASDDKLDITAFNEGEGGTIVVERLNTVNVEFDNTINSYSVYGATVGDALREIGITINESDKINYQLSDPVQNGMIIKLQTSFFVTLNADGAKTKYAIVDGKVSDLISLSGIELGDEDYTKPSLDTQLSSGMTVKVYRVELKTVIETETVEYSTVKKKDSKLSKGKTKTIVKGANGEREITYQVKYVNGKETERVELVNAVTKEPTNAVVKVGTKETEYSSSVKSNGVTSRNGFTVGQTINGRYTHYCACATCNGNSRGVTSSGRRIYNGMSNPYYVACNWLPLGSVIRVGGKNYTVVDRGGSGLSTVGRIDIFTPEGHSECYRLGTGSCKITIVRLGW